MDEARPLAQVRSGWGPLFAAWLVALAATLVELFLGEVVGRTPCQLCWYQNVFMFPLAIILGVASLSADRLVVRYALPLAVGGTLVAGLHVLLRSGFLPERLVLCSRDVPCVGAGTTFLDGLLPPLLTLAAFAAVAVLLLLARPRSPT